MNLSVHQPAIYNSFTVLLSRPDYELFIDYKEFMEIDIQNYIQKYQIRAIIS